MTGYRLRRRAWLRHGAAGQVPSEANRAGRAAPARARRSGIVAEVERAPRDTRSWRRSARRARRRGARDARTSAPGSAPGGAAPRPSAFENSRLVTGFGAEALSGAARPRGLSSAQRISPTSSSRWIQGMYWRPPASGPPSPSLNGGRSCFSSPPSGSRTRPVRKTATRTPPLCRLRAPRPPTRRTIWREPVLGRRGRLVDDRLAALAVVADRALADEHSRASASRRACRRRGSWSPARGCRGSAAWPRR